MTATDVLRQLLDERGVEYFKHEDGEPLRKLEKADEPATSWHMDGASVCAVPIEGSDLFDLWIDHCTPEQAIEATLGAKVTGDTSDGYHTFNELYHHRAVLFSVIVRDHKELAWKSRHHHDGSMYDGMFIVGIDTPRGQATYHYDVDPYWDMFDCRELDRAPEWDGHSPSDAIGRIAALGRGESKDVCNSISEFTCSKCGFNCDLTSWISLFDGDEGRHRHHHHGTPNFCPNCGRRVVK